MPETGCEMRRLLWVVLDDMGLPKSLQLSNGTTIPCIGFGTYHAKSGEIGGAVKVALAAGYRHIDCAWIYQNEPEVGAAIRESGVNRDEIFLTSKLWNGFHQPKHVELNLDQTLKALQTDYLDLYLMHWPVAFGVPDDGRPRGLPRDDNNRVMIDHELTRDFIKTWRAMEALVDKGKIKAIGVSNFSIGRLKKLLRNARIKPVVNQVEVNWTWPQHELVEWCSANNIVIQAYSPLGSHKSSILLSNPIIRNLAAENNVYPAQIIIGWLLKRGIVVLPKSVTPSRIKSNLQPFELSQVKFEELQAQSRVLKNPSRVVEFSKMWGVDIFGDGPDVKL